MKKVYAIRFNDTGTFDAGNGSLYSALQSVAYAANSSYHIKAIINLVDQPYRFLYVFIYHSKTISHA